ncbi:COG4223 family protein [Candidatus Nucleicultrix amoebiphila]|jgi:hypothetical protein|uniref:Uncharacterized protein n=1 Tax=Candidatus Nucleicultrix amoebiphila FS5 TaxID=1414854 RepID=A0A1W6N3S3_9PROT|nr:hypothetical protein [Candidatus Nucleicultrix amoebiphila]ARN84493.1 hypothetical protein GQ61_03205 [Candidatus Nucleicultrix amoebiphila FS5]
MGEKVSDSNPEKLTEKNKSSPRSKGLWLFIGFLILIGGFGYLGYTNYLYEKELRLTINNFDQKIRNADSALEVLSEQVKSLNEKTTQISTATSAEIISHLENKIASLEAWQTFFIESRKNEDAYQNSLKMLKKAVNSGKPYVQELKIMNGLKLTLDGQRSVEELKEFESFGIPSLKFLQESLPEALNEMHRRGQVSSVQGYMHKLWQRLKSLITVRKVTDFNESDTSLEAQLAKIEKSVIEDKDVKIALMMLSQLKDFITPKMQAWITHAEGYQRVDEALQVLANQWKIESVSEIATNSNQGK